MIGLEERIAFLNKPETGEWLAELYGAQQVSAQRTRYATVLRKHEEFFGKKERVLLISAPGRTEIGGNHTDHNHGRVLAAAVNLDALCAVSPREDMIVDFHSEGRNPFEIDLSDLSVRPEEKGTVRALIRGMAAYMKEAGYRIGGFDAAVTSTVAPGSGLSSSAAIEVLLSGVLDALYNSFEMPFVQRAQIGQKAENVYFGKPSGLLDQMASAAGGLVTVDFRNPEAPEVTPLAYDFAKKGYELVVVATGGSHENLTDHYAAIPQEMKQVAARFGQDTLRGITMEQLMKRVGGLREHVSDRAIMRAMHFIQEDERVPVEVCALQEDRIDDFLQAVVASGQSSFMYLQNVFATNEDQSLSLALCMAESLLRGKGAWRIHGGGFAGTTLNFVKTEDVPAFVQTMENAFGTGCCHVLNIRPRGAAMLDPQG